MLKANGVPLGGSEAVIKTAIHLGREAIRAGRSEEAMLYNSILYDVTLDEGIGKCLEGMASCEHAGICGDGRQAA